ncbi:hypothetical protein [Ottowia testudinis]|uniref:Uncharacterized protein n=1 Tax=Ottowia testudinis TaxID=2816950 RepID=A0A975CIZ5_9BURK|nr:hypothetical protein [Ottowia testudinis]QTD45044.1 hypothetical protein J1M35_18750 [Ottowia testudinis]
MTNPLYLDRRRFALALAAPALMTALGGCSTTGSAIAPAADDQAQLLKRAREYWGLIKVNDSVTAWPYEEISKDPQWTLQAYLKRGGIVFNAVEVRGVKSIDGDNAVLTVWMDYALPLLRVKGQQAEADDPWRRIDGVWYHGQRRNPLFSDK